MPDVAARDFGLPAGMRVLDLPAQLPRLIADVPLGARLGMPQRVVRSEDRVGVTPDQVLVGVLVSLSGAEQVAPQVRHRVAADDLGDHYGALRGGAAVLRGDGAAFRNGPDSGCGCGVSGPRLDRAASRRDRPGAAHR